MADSKIPKLVLPGEEKEPQADAAKEQPASPSVVDTEEALEEIKKFEEGRLTAEEKEAVEEFAARIDLRDSAMVMQYGVSAQEKIADFSDSALENVRAKDLGEIGSAVTALVAQLRSIDDEDKGFHLFRRAGSKLETLRTKYSKVSPAVDKICGELEDHQLLLIKDIAVLDKLYDANLENFRELSMYIAAGKLALERTRTVELAALNARAKETGLPEDTQAASDLAALCDRFEKRIYDLELTRTVAVQTAPQIRLIQNNNTVMSEKIQSTLVNTIPLWKSQMIIALGLEHSRQAMEAQKAVTDMTNELLKKNAEALRTGTVETAREAERGIVDIETLTQTNTSLIETLDEVLAIQTEGREKRIAAEAELARIELALRDKLIEISEISKKKTEEQQ